MKFGPVAVSDAIGGIVAHAVRQPGQAELVVAMHPVAQRLPVHPAQARRFSRETPSRTWAIANSRRLCAASRLFAAYARSAADV